MDLDGPDGDRRAARVRRVLEADPEVLGALEDAVGPDPRGRLDRRDVERHLDGLAQAKGAPLQPVGIDRRPATAEVGDDVHEHRGRRQGAILDADDVVDRLEGGPGLAPAVLEHVELGLELLVALEVEAGAAGVGVDLAGPVVDCGEGSVVDPSAAHVLDPGLVGDAERLEVRRRVLRVRRPRPGLGPLLRHALEPPVEGGHDGVATGIDLGAVVRRIGAAEDRPELAPRLQHEVRRQDPAVGGRRQHDHLLHGPVVVLARVGADGQDRACLHQLEDPVAAEHHGRIGGDHEPRRAVGQLLQDRIPHQVEGRGRLGDAGEDRRLGEGELVERHPPVAAGGGGDPVAVVAVEVVVEVGRDDLLLAIPAGEGLGQADRLDDLPDLPLIGGGEGRSRQEPVAHELLGDRRRAASVARDRVDRCRDDAGRIEARVVPEGLVLDRRRRVDRHGRDLVVGDDVAAFPGEGREEHLPGTVVDAGLLVEADAAEDLLGVGETLAVVGEGGDGTHEPHDARDTEGGEQEEGDCDREAGDGAPSGCGPMVGAVPAAALPPREAGLHGVGHDSIEVMNPRPVAAACFDASGRRGVTS